MRANVLLSELILAPAAAPNQVILVLLYHHRPPQPNVYSTWQAPTTDAHHSKCKPLALLTPEKDIPFFPPLYGTPPPLGSYEVIFAA